jgi:hypothetical protein
MTTTPDLFHIMANNREIATKHRLPQAKATAIEESLQYDDVVIIEHDGLPRFMAQYGQLYKLTPAS